MEMIKVVTPFGVGFATSQEDLEKMNMFIEGLKAGMGMMSQAVTAESEDEEPELSEEEEYWLKNKSFFDKRSELVDFVKPYLKGSHIWDVFTDKRKDGGHRIKLWGASIAPNKLVELREKLVGAKYQFRDGSVHTITDVQEVSGHPSWDRSYPSVAIFLQED